MIEPAPVRRTREFDDIADDLDFVFNNYFKTRRWALMPTEKGWKPQTDMYETEDRIVVVIDIAGISTRDISLHVYKNELTIRGVRREKIGKQKRHFHKMEIDFGPFERHLELPAPVDTDNVTTKYLNGFFQINLPKRDLYSTDRIEIEISGEDDE